jgi:hypothetical protein
VSPSALIRRLLRHATAADIQPVMTVAQVEEMARHVMPESA